LAMTDLISRREAIERVTAMLGGIALIGGERVLAVSQDTLAQTAAQGVGTFSRDEVAFLDEIADTILPETTTPGAKAARTGAFMALMVTEAYTERNQQIFRDGMRRLDEACSRDHGAPFVLSSPAQRRALLQRLDAEQKTELDEREAARTSRAPAAPPPAADAPVHYFRLMKELALLGYFTSEVGYRQAMRYVETPGRFDPCAPLAPGEKAWAPHA
jgi:Gluconate 2-dehydrogenase subunit 3